MSNERAEFSKRLAAAMVAQGHEPRPKVLSTQFNVRFKGASVSVTVDGSFVGSHGYNSAVADGRFGLLARSGTTSVIGGGGPTVGG